jgi:uncharacterized protein (UPF0276 family)
MRRKPTRRFDQGPIPATAGIGLRAAHEQAVLAGRPDAAWLEIHSENYFRLGGRAEARLTAIRERYPLSMHGVGLSLGSADPLDWTHLKKLRAAIDRFQPGLISEHVSWGAVDGSHVNDLLPLPITVEALSHLADRVDAVQSFLRRTILLENVSSYFQYAGSDMPEHEFFSELVGRTGCGVLLDVNNLFVNERNHGTSAATFIEGIPIDSVAEIHLAGHSIHVYDEHEIVVDTHDNLVCDEVWSLYAVAIQRFGRVPTLIEWDSDLPGLDVLIGEARKAQLVMDAHDVIAA